MAGKEYSGKCGNKYFYLRARNQYKLNDKCDEIDVRTFVKLNKSAVIGFPSAAQLRHPCRYSSAPARRDCMGNK